MVYFLYLATCKNNGKRYVGVTGQSLSLRMNEHKYASKSGKAFFYRAIRKHGFDSFSFEIIGIFETREKVFSAEISYIRDKKPEYNTTLGGSGNLGLKLSKEAIEKIKSANRGNKYRLGMTHTDDVRQKLRDHAINNFGIFKRYQSLGPAASAKKVVCLDTGEIFESASSAAVSICAAKSAMIELCQGKRGRKTVKGKRFAYLEKVA